MDGPRSNLPALPAGVLLRLGATIARRGPLAAVAFVVSALTVAALVIVAIVVARDATGDPRQTAVHLVPILASSALAWGGGLLFVFATASSALHRDKTDGTRRLVLVRTGSRRAYLFARLGGVAALLGAIVVGGTLVVGLAAMLAARGGVGRTAQATVASLVFALAFVIVIVPVSFAALGARRRLSGYFSLLLLLAFPALLVSLAGLPSELGELLALPTALAAVRESLAPGSVDPFRLLRALVALAIAFGVAVLLVRRDVIVLDAEGDA